MLSHHTESGLGLKVSDVDDANVRRGKDETDVSGSNGASPELKSEQAVGSRT